MAGLPFFIVVTEHAEATRTFKIEGDLAVIGRTQALAVPLPRVTVSKRHARITRALDGSLFVDDAKSTNGTFVNGKRITGSHKLKAEDRIFIGDYTLLVQAWPEGKPLPPEVKADRNLLHLWINAGDALERLRELAGDRAVASISAPAHLRFTQDPRDFRMQVVNHDFCFWVELFARVHDALPMWRYVPIGESLAERSGLDAFRTVLIHGRPSVRDHALIMRIFEEVGAGEPLATEAAWRPHISPKADGLWEPPHFEGSALAFCAVANHRLLAVRVDEESYSVTVDERFRFPLVPGLPDIF